MPSHLFILRHAQTHSGQHYNSDKERELKPEGIRQATHIGTYLKQHYSNIDLIIASDAVRAKVTAALIASELGDTQRIQLAEQIYSGSLNQILDVISNIPDSVKRVLLVGHCPTIIELSNYLSGQQKNNMETCELTLLQLENRWSEINAGVAEIKLNYSPSL